MKKYLITFVILMSIIFSFKFFAGANTNKTESAKATVDGVITRHQTLVDSINKAFKEDKRKDALNNLFSSDIDLLKENNESLALKSKTAEDYLISIYKGNLFILKFTLNNLEEIKLDKETTKEDNTKINAFFERANLLKDKLEIYRKNNEEIFFNMRKIIDLKIDCKYKVSENDFQFEKEDCHSRFYKIINEIILIQKGNENVKLYLDTLNFYINTDEKPTANSGLK